MMDMECSKENLKNEKNTSFKILIMGGFGSGKNAFVKTLLGEKQLLEVGFSVSGLIREVHYGKEKKIIIFPKAGRCQEGDAPFEIEPNLAEIEKHFTINNKAGLNGVDLDYYFEKMVVYWPLEMLKDGISIIDIPGKYAPYDENYIVETYVLKADAILYCMSGVIDDERTLEYINAMGFKPVIVSTCFDVVTECMSEYEVQEFMDRTFNNYYSRYTKREYCHYVDSKLGLTAKQNQSYADYVDSGYYELEKHLERLQKEKEKKSEK